jgi:hypothetical protein
MNYSLTAPVESQRFRKESLLRKALAKQDVTTLVPLHTPADIKLDVEGHVCGGFRFSTFAMQQFCFKLAPGLSKLVLGLTKDAWEKQLAIKLLNALSQHRFASVLSDCRLLVDQRAKRVDGVVGARYEYLSNTALYEQCRALAQPEKAIFHEAVLEGRRMLLRYRYSDKAYGVSLEIDGKVTRHGFVTGWHFTNSEVGDRSVNVSPILIREGTYAAAGPAPTQIQRMIHVQTQDFARKVGEMIARSKDKALDMPTMRAALIRISRQPLGLGGGTVEDLEKHRTALVSKLTDKGKIPHRLAEQIVNRVLAHGSEKVRVMSVTEQLTGPLLERCQHRSVYDLYSSLTGSAVSQDIKSRERLEQLAYRVLTNRFTV